MLPKLMKMQCPIRKLSVSKDRPIDNFINHFVLNILNIDLELFEEGLGQKIKLG
jgi:hypothetical protein